MTSIHNHFACLSGGTQEEGHIQGTNICLDHDDYSYTATGGVAVGNNYGGMQACSFVGNWVTDSTCNDVNDYWATAQASYDAPLPRRSRRSRKKASESGGTTITTVNTTNSGPMLDYLADTKSWGVELIQEHHTVPGGMNAMVTKVRKLGYKFCAAHAIPSGRSDSGSSGGAAVVVRNCYGVESLFGIHDEKQPWMIFPGRAAGALILGMIRGGIIFISLYLKTGEAPNSEMNWRILIRVAEILNAGQKPFIIGGDFQCTPAELRATDWLNIVKGTIVASGDITCTTGSSAREIDFFIASTGLDSVLAKPSALHGTCVATHCPVATTMEGNPRALTVQGFVMPRSFPRREAYGPIRKLRPWPPFTPSSNDDAKGKMDSLAAYWMQNSEEELCQRFDLVDDSSGAPLDKFCGRALKPVICNMKPMQHPASGNVQCGVRGTYWQSIGHRLSEISRWFLSYRTCTDDTGGITTRGKIWEQEGFTRHVTTAAKKLLRRFQTPPKTVLRTDLDLINQWNRRIIEIMDMMRYVLYGCNVLGTECISDWSLEIDDLVKQIQTMLTTARSEEFGEWLDLQLKGGAGGIHAATKEPVGCFSDPIHSLEPGVHASQQIVDLEIIKWAQPKIWKAWPTQEEADHDFEANPWFARQDDFPALRPAATVEEQRLASGTFAWKTCIGADNIHPRMIQQLSATGLKYLSMLQLSTEALSCIPDLFRINTLFTRPKKNGAYRVVGSLPTFYRVYARLRLKELRTWETDNPCDLFWASRGKGADVAVHTAATAADIGGAQGLITAAALVDIFKCFEVLCHNTIIRKCKIVNFPMDILAVALSMYAAARYLILNGAVGGPVYTHRGITAGCSFACYILRGTMQADMILFFNDHCKPYGTILQIFIDDLLLMHTGTKSTVITRVATATTGLVQVLDNLHMPAADDKKFIIASPAVGTSILLQMKDKEFRHQVVGEQLGVDFAPGRRAGFAARDKRAVIFGARLPKIRAFTRKRAAVGRRMAATAGIPTIGFSQMVLGTSGARLAWHQTIIHRTLTATNTQRSKHLNLSVAGEHVEPAYNANRAPPMQWARMVHKKVFSLRDLRLAVQHYQHAMKVAKHPWAIVTGTITALLATLQRIGWTMVGAHLFKDTKGHFIDIRTTPWRTLQAAIDNDTNVCLWKKHTKGTTAEGTFAQGASSAIVQGLVGTSSPLDKEHRHALTSAATGGQWPQVRHVKAGHDVDELCLLCGTAAGTEWHRIYDCPATDHLRTIHLDLGVQRRAWPNECSHHPRWTRGHLPASAYPAPPMQHYGNRHIWFREEPGVFLGEAFLDGSASNPIRPELSASACSIVGMQILHGMPRMELRLDVMLASGIDGPEAAEISAVEYLLENCVLPIVAWSDCQNVVDAFERGYDYCTSPEHAYCIYWRRVFARLQDHGCPGGLVIHKIKAHTTAANFGDYGMSFLQWQGNRNADKGALSTALLMAEELNLKGCSKEYDEIEADHRGLCLWIARITAYTNSEEHRDAVAAPEGFVSKGRTATPSILFKKKTPKRVRITVPDAVRMFGNPSGTEIQFVETDGNYAGLDPPGKRFRLTGKTSREDAATMGFDDMDYAEMNFDWSNTATEAADDDIDLEQALEEVMDDELAQEEPQPPPPQQPDPLAGHGGLLLQTANIVWCVRCGASAQLGATSKYLRAKCKDKPENESMEARKGRLVRGVHPTTCAKLNSSAKRVRIL